MRSVIQAVQGLLAKPEPERVPAVPQHEKTQTQAAAAPRAAPAAVTVSAQELRRQRHITIDQAASMVPSEEMLTLAADAWRKARPKPNGWCLRHVRWCLEALGLGYREGAGTAIRQAELLRRDPNFIEVTGVTIDNVNSLPPGAVVLYERPRSGFGRPGHAVISCGRGRYASDFRSDNNVFRGRPRDEYVFAFIPVHRGKFTFDPAQARAVRDREVGSGSGSYAADGSYIPGENSLYSQLDSQFMWSAFAAEFMRLQKAEEERREQERRKNQRDRELEEAGKNQRDREFEEARKNRENAA